MKTPVGQKTKKLTKHQLLTVLQELANTNDPESAHADADNLLLEYINDAAIKKAFHNIKKWYA